MILHYLKIVFRQMAKRKAQTAISILGITAGLLCFSVCNYYKQVTRIWQLTKIKQKYA